MNILYNSEKINNDDVSYLERAFSIKEISSFSDSILKTEIKGTRYFIFPFIDKFKNETSFKLFNINYRKNVGNDEFSYWSTIINPKHLINTILIGDDPLSLMKYYSQNIHLFKKKTVQFIVPYFITYDSISHIKENYTASDIYTVFTSPSKKEYQKLISSAVFSNKDFRITKPGADYILISGNKEITTSEINFLEHHRNFRFYSEVKHKKV